MADEQTHNSDEKDAARNQNERAESSVEGSEMPADTAVREDNAESDAEDGRLKRKFARYAAPLVVVINNHCYNALDWSLGGFRIGEARDLGLAGERVKATILIKFEGFAMSFAAMSELVRLDPATREAAFRFTDLTSEQTRFLSHFSSAFLAGRMQSIDGVLRHTRPASDGQSDEGEEKKRGNEEPSSAETDETQHSYRSNSRCVAYCSNVGSAAGQCKCASSVDRRAHNHCWGAGGRKGNICFGCRWRNR